MQNWIIVLCDNVAFCCCFFVSSKPHRYICQKFSRFVQEGLYSSYFIVTRSPCEVQLIVKVMMRGSHTPPTLHHVSLQILLGGGIKIIYVKKKQFLNLCLFLAIDRDCLIISFWINNENEGKSVENGHSTSYNWKIKILKHENREVGASVLVLAPTCLEGSDLWKNPQLSPTLWIAGGQKLTLFMYPKHSIIQTDYMSPTWYR